MFKSRRRKSQEDVDSRVLEANIANIATARKNKHQNTAARTVSAPSCSQKPPRPSTSARAATASRSKMPDALPPLTPDNSERWACCGCDKVHSKEKKKCYYCGHENCWEEGKKKGCKYTN